MSAASFLGISALVYTSGYDGLIYSIGFLIGWPIILFLIAERLRNLGRYTLPMSPLPSAAETDPYSVGLRLVGGGGAVSDRADGRCRQADPAAVRAQLPRSGDLVGILMVLYVLFGGMLATTRVQIIKAVLLLAGASFMALMVMKSVNFDFNTLFAEAVKVHPKGIAIMSHGGGLRSRFPRCRSARR